MPSGSDVRSAVTLRSSSAAPGTEEEGGEGGQEGGEKGGEGGYAENRGGGEGGEGGEGTGQQSAEPQPASKHDCWQNGPPFVVLSIHLCFEQALPNNLCTAGTDRQSPHFLPPLVPIDLGALSSHITHDKGAGGEGGAAGGGGR